MVRDRGDLSLDNLAAVKADPDAGAYAVIHIVSILAPCVWNSCSLDALRSLSACFPRTTLRFKSRFHPAPPISAHAVQSLTLVLGESPATVLAYLVRIKLHPYLYLAPRDRQKYVQRLMPYNRKL